MSKILFPWICSCHTNVCLDLLGERTCGLLPLISCWFGGEEKQRREQAPTQERVRVCGRLERAPPPSVGATAVYWRRRHGERAPPEAAGVRWEGAPPNR